MREVLPKLEDRGEGLVYLLPLPPDHGPPDSPPLSRTGRKTSKWSSSKSSLSCLFPPIRWWSIFIPRRKNAGKERTLVFAVRKGDLGEHLSLLKEAGLDPESVVPEALALFWLVRGLGKTSAGSGALLDLGQEKATLILWQKDRLEPGPFHSLCRGRSVPAAAHHLSRLAEEVNGPSSPPDMVRKAGRWRKSFSPEETPLARGWRRSWETFCRHPFPPRPGGDRAGMSPRRPAPLWRRPWAPPGRGLRRGVNLRREEFASSQKAQRARGRLKILVSYAFILGVLGIAAFLLNYSLKERRYQDLKAEIRKEFSQALPEVKRVVNELQQMKARVQEERAKLGSLGGGGGSGSPLEILRELSLMVDPAMKVRVTELIVDPEAIEVNGEADSFDTVNQLKGPSGPVGRISRTSS